MVDDAIGESTLFTDLLSNLYSLFLAFKKNNVVISVDKFLISHKVAFGGIMLDASEGELKFYPDPSRIAALKNLQRPKNRKELLSFLGTLATFQKWTPSLSFVTKHLRLLSSKNSVFKWTDEHQIEFNKAKSIISDLKRLSPFDKLKDTKLIVDGSGESLGYILVQPRLDGGKNFIKCNSVGLTDAQTNYAPIEIKKTLIHMGHQGL